MEEKQLVQIEKWFIQLNQNIDGVEQRLDQKIENRFTALLTVCTNTRNDLGKLRDDFEQVKKDVELIRLDVQFLRESQEKYDKYDARITVLELALKEIERRLTH